MYIVPRKKMEIFIEEIYKDFIIKILQKHRVRDFMCLPIVDGAKHGDEDFISNLERICITIIVEICNVEDLAMEIKRLLKQPQPVIILSDIEQIIFNKE